MASPPHSSPDPRILSPPSLEKLFLCKNFLWSPPVAPTHDHAWFWPLLEELDKHVSKWGSPSLICNKKQQVKIPLTENGKSVCPKWPKLLAGNLLLWKHCPTCILQKCRHMLVLANPPPNNQQDQTLFKRSAAGFCKVSVAWQFRSRWNGHFKV